MVTLLQIIISVVVIYLIFSVIVYVIVEWLSAFLQLRGKLLRQSIISLFNCPNSDLGKLIYRHPQIDTLRKKAGKLTSYIPASNISSALVEIVSSRVSSPSTDNRVANAYKDFLQGVDTFESTEIKTLLVSLAQQSINIDTLNASIEKWYNDCMDRVSGWYKKKIKLVTLIIALIVTLAFNVDTIYIIHASKADPQLRQRLNELGVRLTTDSAFNNVIGSLPTQESDYFESYVNDSSVNGSDAASVTPTPEELRDSSDASADTRLEQLRYMNRLVEDSDLPVGWPNKNTSMLFTILGWLLTMLALSAGAPFWFDMLKRLINIRSTGPKPVK